ncbi:MAG: DNA topoisomerase VI subunit B [Planctomycetes bacterium]|nr:DNA topoisomerase VI subunit B [Planctomycetota bacterium]NOG53292.1 DNA topoisomerase VI subunit B [Planctomycetota bacterium]
MAKKKSAAKPREGTPAGSRTKGNARKGLTAEAMAGRQREISVSEFFAKNRHLLGFDNARKAMLTTVKEAVDNALDACEDGGILPDLLVEVLQTDESRFKITVRDNGPGIVRKQVENIFGKLLYGSKFHRLKMSRGQQGIGISAAGMYGLMTTGKPVLIISKTRKNKPAHEVLLRMDTSKNKAEVIADTEHPEDDQLFPHGHGTQVTIELEGRYLKGRQSIDEYLEQTAIANPHARIEYRSPTGERTVYERTVDELPPETVEIKPHPKGIELGTLIQMLERTSCKQLGAFFKNDFCRVGPAVAKQICAKAKLTDRTWIKQVEHDDAERLYKAIQDVKIMAPPTNCLSPIGTKTLLAGLLKEVRAEFYAASTRPPAVYRGRPFIIEAAVAYGGDLPSDESARIIRFANRVPLLYQQSGCSAFKSVLETNWRNYGLSQPRGAVPTAPVVVMIHMASVWVPFTSESKEAIADYDEIRKEMRLALQECGRKLQTYLRRRQRMKRQGERRNVFLRYIGEISKACESITGTEANTLYEALMQQAERKTAEADRVLDDEGNVINDPTDDDGGRKLAGDDGVVIRTDVIQSSDLENEDDDDSGSLFNGNGNGNGNGSRTKTKKKRRKKTRRKG